MGRRAANRSEDHRRQDPPRGGLGAPCDREEQPRLCLTEGDSFGERSAEHVGQSCALWAGLQHRAAIKVAMAEREAADWAVAKKGGLDGYSNYVSTHRRGAHAREALGQVVRV